MNMHVEHNEVTGEKRFVHVSRSGRRYRGATAAEAERKTLLAHLHALKRTIDGPSTPSRSKSERDCAQDDERSIAEEMCARLYAGVVSFGDLSIEQMRELKNTYIDSLRFGREMEKAQRLEPLATDKQIKLIVKLGRYSIITEKYGTGFLWRKLPEWVVRYKGAKRVVLGDLTNQEAWCVIRRLGKIEQRLLEGKEHVE